MSEQYFASQPTSPQNLREVVVNYDGHLFHFKTDAGVFSRDELDPGSRLLLDACLPRLTGRVLDLGCGWGPVGTIIASLCPACQVVLSDINQRAVDLAKGNTKRNNSPAEVVLSNGFDSLSGQFDWVLSNPPIRAGKQVIYQLFSDASRRLHPGGTLAVVIRKQQGALSAKEYLQTLFPQITLAARKKGYHVFLCKAVER